MLLFNKGWFRFSFVVQIFKYKDFFTEKATFFQWLFFTIKLFKDAIMNEDVASFYVFMEEVMSKYRKRDLKHLSAVTTECQSAIAVFTKAQQKETNTKVPTSDINN